MEYVTVKCYADTRRLLRLIAAQTDEQMVQVLDRLCRDEWARLVVTPLVTSDENDDQAPPTHRTTKRRSR